MYGKTYMGIERATFLIDGTGKVVEDGYANWTTHPNNPASQAAE